jgi:hypothetical protein
MYVVSVCNLRDYFMLCHVMSCRTSTKERANSRVSCNSTVYICSKTYKEGGNDALKIHGDVDCDGKLISCNGSACIM